MEEMEETRFVIIGTEGGAVRFVHLVSDRTSEPEVITKADNLALKYNRRGLHFTVWDYTVDRSMYVVP
jgi:hypothetical protein